MSSIGAFFRALLVRRKDIEGDMATSMLLSTVSSLAMFVGMVAMFAASIGSLASIFLIQIYVTEQLFIRRVTLAVLSLITFVFANLFRISRYEIQKSHDSNYLNTVLTTILTIIGTLITIIQIFKDR